MNNASIFPVRPDPRSYQLVPDITYDDLAVIYTDGRDAAKSQIFGAVTSLVQVVGSVRRCTQ